MTDQPTQTRHPWRATTRTVFAVIVALASLLPVIAIAGGIDTKAGVVQILAVCAAITRILAMPAVNDFLREVAPWLAAEPKPER